MKEIILEVLDEVACGNGGSCQINLQSQSAQIMIADKIMEKLDPYLNQLIEDIVVGQERESLDG
tara:strand:- start:292 stop:483 length:192 start_codon:yes stop_codon:yes gene_type:complete